MIQESAQSRASTQTLWSFASDVLRWSEHLPTITSVRHVDGSEPTAVGSRYEVRQPGLPRAVYTVTEYDPGRRFVWETRSPLVIARAEHTVSATPSGSRLELGLHWTGPLAGLMRLALQRKARRMVRIEADTFTRLADAA